MWTYDTATGRFRATVGNRQFDIEPPTAGLSHRNWTLWFRRNTQPHKSLQIGAFPSTEQAKQAAQDIIQQLTGNAAVLQE